MFQDAAKVFCHRHGSEPDTVVSSGGCLYVGYDLRILGYGVHGCYIPSNGNHVEVAVRIKAGQMTNIP